MKNYLFLLSFPLLLLGGSPATPPPSGVGVQFPDVNLSRDLNLSDPKRRALAESFLRYWHAREKGDTNTTYSYELPYQRYITPYHIYSKEVGGLYYGVKTELREISFPDRNVAIIVRRVYYSDGSFYDKKDKWIFSHGRWYHKYYQTVFPPNNGEEMEFQ